MSITFEKLIRSFIDGMQDNDPQSISTTKTLKIQGDQLVHYWTPIAERVDGKVIVNITRYSLSTGMLQKQLKTIIPPEKYISVKGVPEGYKETLANFLPKK